TGQLSNRGHGISRAPLGTCQTRFGRHPERGANLRGCLWQEWRQQHAEAMQAAPQAIENSVQPRLLAPSILCERPRLFLVDVPVQYADELPDTSESALEGELIHR